MMSDKETPSSGTFAEPIEPIEEPFEVKLNRTLCSLEQKILDRERSLLLDRATLATIKKEIFNLANPDFRRAVTNLQDYVETEAQRRVNRNKQLVDNLIESLKRVPEPTIDQILAAMNVENKETLSAKQEALFAVLFASKE